MRSAEKPEWLETDWLLGRFGSDRQSACRAYNEFVLNGRGLLSPLREVKHQMLLGDKEFIEEHINAVPPEELGDIARVQRRSVALSLEEYSKKYGNREEAMAHAYWSMAYSMPEIARYFETSTRTVGRAVKLLKVNV